MFRLLVVASALFSTAFAAFATFMVIRFHEGAAGGLLLKAAVGVGLVSIAAAIVLYALKHVGSPWAVLLGAIALIVFGSASVPWMYHIGYVTGDYEYGIMLFAMILAAQGAITILYLWREKSFPEAAVRAR